MERRVSRRLSPAVAKLRRSQPRDIVLGFRAAALGALFNHFSVQWLPDQKFLVAGVGLEHVGVDRNRTHGRTARTSIRTSGAYQKSTYSHALMTCHFSNTIRPEMLSASAKLLHSLPFSIQRITLITNSRLCIAPYYKRVIDWNTPNRSEGEPIQQ